MCILKDIYCIVPQGLGMLLMAGNHSERKEIPSQEYPGLSWLEMVPACEFCKGWKGPEQCLLYVWKTTNVTTLKLLLNL